MIIGSGESSVITSVWAAKFWLLPDALRDHRSDTALVRLTVFEGAGRDDVATATATDFAQEVYPLLRDLLPR